MHPPPIYLYTILISFAIRFRSPHQHTSRIYSTRIVRVHCTWASFSSPSLLSIFLFRERHHAAAAAQPRGSDFPALPPPHAPRRIIDRARLMIFAVYWRCPHCRRCAMNSSFVMLPRATLSWSFYGRRGVRSSTRCSIVYIYIGGES